MSETSFVDDLTNDHHAARYSFSIQGTQASCDHFRCCCESGSIFHDSNWQMANHSNYPNQPDKMMKNRFTKNYFTFLTGSILIISLIAFSDNIITDVGQESNKYAKFIIHGILSLLWISGLLYQSLMIRKGKVLNHQRIGIYLGVVAIGFYGIAIWMLYASGLPNMPMLLAAKFNRAAAPISAVLVGLGFFYKQKPILHKHLMITSILLIMEPMLSRFGGHVGIGPELSILVVWQLLFISLFVYDWMSSRKIHPVTYLGYLYLMSAWVYIIATTS